MDVRRTSFRPSLAVAAVLAAACSREQPAAAAPPPPEVGVVTVAASNVPLQYEYSAQVVPYRRVEVRPRVEGIIEARPFTEGALVKVGQLLYRIESEKYEAAYRATEARVTAGKLRMERYEPLLAQHAVAAQDVDLARSELEAAQAALAQAKRDYDDTNVRAEMEGRVGRTNLEVGARVSGPADLLTTIDRLDPVYVTFQPPTAQLLEWSRSTASRALTRAGSDLKIEAILPDGSVLPRTGRLDFVAPSLESSTGTQEFRAVFANPDRILVPGQFVRARLVGFNAEAALTVPQRAVQTSLGRQFVYVVAAGDTVQSREIVPGPWSGNRWIIREGLSAGDRVVVDGIQKVRAGRPVRPVPAIDSSVAAAPGGAGR